MQFIIIPWYNKTFLHKGVSVLPNIKEYSQSTISHIVIFYHHADTEHSILILGSVLISSVHSVLLY